MTQQLTVGATSPGLFMERVTKETPGLFPLGSVILLE